MNKDQILKLIELKMLAQRQTLIKGEKGDTPVFGVDYWTKDQVESVINSILELVDERIDEIKPVHGEDYMTESEIQDIVDHVNSLITVPKDGKDAEIDYERINNYVDTLVESLKQEIDYSKIQELIKTELPKYEEETGESIVRKINELEITPGLQIDAAHIKNLPEVVRGTVTGPRNIKNMITAGSNITITGSGTLSDPYEVSSTGGGSPGGSDTQLQFNNSGTFGGVTGATTNGTAVTFATDGLLVTNIKASSSAGILLESNNGTDVLTLGSGGGSNATFAGGVNITGDLAVDTNVLYVDTTNNRVGIGLTNPSVPLEVANSSASNIQASSSAGSMGLTFKSTLGGTFTWKYWWDRIFTFGLKWDYGGATKMVLSQNGDLTLAGALSFAGDLSMSSYKILGSGSSYINMYDAMTGNMILRASTFSTAVSKIRFQTGTTSTDRVIIDGNGNVVIGATVADRLFHVEVSDAVTNAVTYAERISHITSGTATTGFGTGIEYELENGSGTNRVAATQEVTWSDATNATEDATLTEKLILNGTLTTVRTTLSTGATTFAGAITSPNFIESNNAITASGNAATVPVANSMNTVTNNSAATLTITLATSGAVDRQKTVVCILDASAAAQTITWVNTEDSTVTAPTTSNGSTTLPLTVGFIYNAATSKWRTVAKA